MKYTLNDILNVSKEIGTPCFLVNTDMFLTNLNNITNAFKTRYENLIVGYSFKTNYLPLLCNLALKQGCYAEVVSFLEYQIAEFSGYPCNKIIFNGPIKRKDELFHALNNQTLVNIDSNYEIDYIEEYQKNNGFKELNIGIRINIALSQNNGQANVYGGANIGRFGFMLDELAAVIARLKKINCNIISLHGHTSSRDRAVSNYEQICHHMLATIKKFNLNIKYFDVGGGFFGPIPKGMLNRSTPSYQDYANAITNILLSDDWFTVHRPALVIEPGMSVAASSMSYLTKVFTIRKRGGRFLAQVDGDMFHIRPSMHKLPLPFDIYRFTDEKSCEVIDKIEVVGSTCMESDILLEIDGQRGINEGDYILVNNVGAYTFVENTNFIQFSPSIAYIQDKEIKCVRKGNDFDNFIKIYIY